MDICLAIKVLQKNKLIHRDLKPENLFIDDNHKIKIGDFGVSKKLETNRKYAYTSVGTSFYMAPEIIKGEAYNNKVDIWSFGCIIYELFTLKVCFKSNSIYGYIENIVNKEHGKIDLSKYNPKWQDLINLLLKKNYNERPDINKVHQLLIDLNKINKEENDSSNSNETENQSKEEKKVEKTKETQKSKFEKLSKEQIEYLRKQGNKVNRMTGKKIFIIFVKYSYYFRSISSRKKLFNKYIRKKLFKLIYYFSFLSGKHSDTIATIGIENFFSACKLSDGSLAFVEIIDTAGQERYKALSASHYRKADCCLLVYDISNKESFDEIKNYYIGKIKDYCKENIQIVLLGNKTDLEKNRQIPSEEGAKLALENDFIFMESSCFKNENVANAFETLIEITNIEKQKSNTIPRNMVISMDDITTKKRNSCCYW